MAEGQAALVFHIKGAKAALFQQNGKGKGFLHRKPLAISKMSHEDWNQSGKRQLVRGNCKKAIARFEMALASFSTSCEYLVNRSTAVYWLMKAEGRPSEGAGEMLAGAARDCQFVVDSYMRDLPAKPDPKLQAHYERLKYAVDLHADIRELHQSLFNVQTYLSRAEQSKLAGNMRGALADYSEALLIEPGNLGALVARANLNFVFFDNKLAAERDFIKIAKIAPVCSEAHAIAEKRIKEMAGSDYIRF